MKRSPLYAFLTALLMMGSFDLFAGQSAVTDVVTPPDASGESTLNWFELAEAEKPQYDEADLMQRVVYPEVAREAGVEGVVMVELVVNADGRPVDPRIVMTSSPLFGETALDAVRETPFVPATRNGLPVRVRMALPVRFSLKA